MHCDMFLLRTPIRDHPASLVWSAGLSTVMVLGLFSSAATPVEVEVRQLAHGMTWVACTIGCTCVGSFGDGYLGMLHVLARRWGRGVIRVTRPARTPPSPVRESELSWTCT
jgi:hypothetical protein